VANFVASQEKSQMFRFVTFYAIITVRLDGNKNSKNGNEYRRPLRLHLPFLLFVFLFFSIEVIK
jgi:hypothetical protein